MTQPNRMPLPGLKPKDLVGIPWMVARALQAPYYTGRIKREADRAWLAGFLDGEGTISFVERNRGPDHTPTHDARVFITNTDREPLDYFASLTAGHVYEHDGERVGRFGSKPCYRWQMGTHDAALLLRELYPYLRTKRRQAALIWTLYTTLRHKNGHSRTPETVVARRREIAEMVRSLNSGGDVTLPAWVEEPPGMTEPGWYLRSEVIWAKPNPMPESVTDRPTKAHEQVFLLSKRATYYYDADAVREGAGDDRVRLGKRPISDRQQHMQDVGMHGKSDSLRDYSRTERNMRSVWTIATEPYPGAHFATFPRKLVEPCVKAGTSEKGVCPECGAPWVRVREFTGEVALSPDLYGRPRQSVTSHDTRHDEADDRLVTSQATGGPLGFGTKVHRTTGWQPSCSHQCRCDLTLPHDAEHGPVPAVVLDPFAGSGTTLLVAQALGRRAIGIDLNPDYLRQCLERNRQMPLGMGAA